MELSSLIGVESPNGSELNVSSFYFDSCQTGDELWIPIQWHFAKFSFQQSWHQFQHFHINDKFSTFGIRCHEHTHPALATQFHVSKVEKKIQGWIANGASTKTSFLLWSHKNHKIACYHVWIGCDSSLYVVYVLFHASFHCYTKATAIAFVPIKHVHRYLFQVLTTC